MSVTVKFTTGVPDVVFSTADGWEYKDTSVIIKTAGSLTAQYERSLVLGVEKS